MKFANLQSIRENVLESYHIIAFTHRNIDINEIGLLHIEEAKQADRLSLIKEQLNLDELLFLSTCNRHV